DLDVGVHGLLQVAADVGDAVLGRGTVAQTLQQLDGRILHARGQLRHLDHLGVLRGGDAGAAAEDVDVQQRVGARRLPPWTDTQAVSPAAYSPGMVSVALRSTSPWMLVGMPPMP